MKRDFRLLAAQIVRLQSHRFFVSMVPASGSQQNVSHGVRSSGQHFGVYIEALNRLLHNLLTDVDHFSWFKIHGSREIVLVEFASRSPKQHVT